MGITVGAGAISASLIMFEGEGQSLLVRLAGKNLQFDGDQIIDQMHAQMLEKPA
jgi:hypothetical protein